MLGSQLFRYIYHLPFFPLLSPFLPPLSPPHPPNSHFSQNVFFLVYKYSPLFQYIYRIYTGRDLETFLF